MLSLTFSPLLSSALALPMLMFSASITKQSPSTSTSLKLLTILEPALLLVRKLNRSLNQLSLLKHQPLLLMKCPWPIKRERSILSDLSSKQPLRSKKKELSTLFQLLTIFLLPRERKVPSTTHSANQLTTKENPCKLLWWNSLNPRLPATSTQLSKFKLFLTSKRLNFLSTLLSHRP